MAETTAGSAAAGDKPTPGAAPDPNSDAGTQGRTRRRAAKAAAPAPEGAGGRTARTAAKRSSKASGSAAKAASGAPGGPDPSVPSDAPGDAAQAAPTRRRRAKAVSAADSGEAPQAGDPSSTAPAKRTRRRAGAEPTAEAPVQPAPPGTWAPPTTAVVFMAPQPELPLDSIPTGEGEAAGRPTRRARRDRRAPEPAVEPEPEVIEPETTPTRRARRSRRGAEPAVEAEPTAAVEEEEVGDDDEDLDSAGSRRRRRGRRGRGRGRGPLDTDEAEVPEAADAAEAPGDEGLGDEEPLTRRRRRRRRSGSGAEAEGAADDGVVTVVRVRQPRDEVQGVTGSTRLEAKRQRRRDGREQRRTRPPILSESEFLARREAVDRVMVVRQRGDRTQVAVLEDEILVEHYVARQSATTMVGNVYLGKVQNVLPSMEAAFVDIGRGRNAVLYAGEVNWDATGLEGRARSIEQALKSGESVLVQVTKDPIGHKGARLTSHIALSGRHLVYVPNGHASGISRKLSDVERRRLRDILKNLVPDGAGVIVRTAAEGASEEDLARDVKRLQAQWEDIQTKAAGGSAPAAAVGRARPGDPRRPRPVQ